MKKQQKEKLVKKKNAKGGNERLKRNSTYEEKYSAIKRKNCRSGDHYSNIKNIKNKTLLVIIRKKNTKKLHWILNKKQKGESLFSFVIKGKCLFLIPPVPGKSLAQWLSGEHVKLMTWWLWVRSPVEANFLSGVISPLISAEAFEKSSQWLWKEKWYHGGWWRSCVSWLSHTNPCKNIAESIRRYHLIEYLLLDLFKYLQIIKHDFYHDVKYLRIFEYQINKYERIKEYMNANHKFETRV